MTWCTSKRRRAFPRHCERSEAIHIAAREAELPFRAPRNDKPLHPRPYAFDRVLETLDLVLLAHGQPDIVQPVEQRVLAVRLDVESHYAAVGAADLLLFQVDAQCRIGAALGIAE